MSTEREIVENAVSAYLKLPTSKGSVTKKDTIETLSESDAMIDALERIGSLFIREAAALRRRRNQEHSPLCHLPQELLVEILLLSIDWCWWDLEKLRTLACVATSWRDTILSCNRFWPVMDVAASEEARKITMKRNRGGAVDLWLWGNVGTSALNFFMNDIKTIHPTRLRSVLYEHDWNTGEFMEYLQNNSSNVIDLFLGDFRGATVSASLDLASDGSSLRHVDTRSMGLPWHSPRFTNLRTISLRDFKYHIPQIPHLYAILSSSPELERLCMINISPSDEESLGSLPTSARPIHLPMLKTLALSHLFPAIGYSIIPLIRASACHTTVIDGGSDVPLALEPHETTAHLISKSVTLSKSLKLGVEEGDFNYIRMRSEPVIASHWACWAHDKPGINIKLAIPSTEVLPRLWNYLDAALNSHGGTTRIESIEVEWMGQEMAFPFVLLEHCPALASLQISDDDGATFDPLIQFLGGNGMKGSVRNSEPQVPLPKLSSFRLSGKAVPNLEVCVAGTQTFLERRYPVIRDSVVASHVLVLKDLCLPFPLVDALQQREVVTSFDLENIRGVPDLVTDCGILETPLSEDATNEVLVRIKGLSVQEKATLNRRWNHENSMIHRLPQELITEILLLAVDWAWWDVEKLRCLASVSAAWRDTILSCNRFWPVIDVMASAEARAVAMERNRKGPVDIWCWERPGQLEMDKFMIDVQTIKPTRVRSVLYEFCPQSTSFMGWLQSNTSNIIDIFMVNLSMNESGPSLELSLEGPNLRHIDLRKISVQWGSSRLSNLHTIYLSDLKHNVPSVDRLYSILSSSPNLERLCLIDVVAADGQALGSVPAAAPPLNLPVLQTLTFNSVSTAITSNIIPLIRTPACHTVIVRERGHPVRLELQQTTIELIARAITLSTTLQVKMEVSDGKYVRICSDPVIPQEWGYWAHDEPGVDIKLAIPSQDALPRLWEHLENSMRSQGETIRITSLQVGWTGQAFPFPFALLEHCPALTEMRFEEELGTTLHPLLQFLGTSRGGGGRANVGSAFQVPNLSSLRFHATIVPDLENCVRASKELLERRYPTIQESGDASPIQSLRDLWLPIPLTHALGQYKILTSLDLGTVLR
ncbi:hypothetical protein FRC01_001111 [Tulasnella sp. 417]|nr:hypothetical protein FRC01_001111 [Tulasnella sp. 417]